MAETKVSRPQGEIAADLFGGMFESDIANRDQFVEEGELVRLNTPEAQELFQRYQMLMHDLPRTVDRSTFRNRVANTLYNHDGSSRERQRVMNLANKVDGAFETTLLKPGVQLNQQQAKQAPTEIDLSSVTDAKTGAEVFFAILSTHLVDSAGFNVNEPADSANSRYNGQRVRLTGPETNRLKSLIDELFDRLPLDQRAELRASIAAYLQQAPQEGY